jgi:transcription elongation GreA/GreB family factor
MLITIDEYERLRSGLEALSVDGRRQMNDRLRNARVHGNREGSPPLYDLLVEQARLERRIATLEAQVAAARIVAPRPTALR